MKTLLFLMLFCSVASASVNVLSSGRSIGPAQDIDVIGASVSGNGPIKTLDVNNISGATTMEDVSIDGSIYIGSATADGSWCIKVETDDSLQFQRRESGVWVEKGKVEP